MTDLPNISLRLYALTDVGMVRSGNEDNFLILDLSTGEYWTASEETNLRLLDFTQGYYGSLIAVSDGMGGALAGEVASRMAVETVRDRMLQLQAHPVYRQLPFPERLRLAIEEANLLINGESHSNPEHKGLGATFTAAGVQGNRVYFGQVGDSRAYLIRKGKITRITKDQSLVQQLIDAGQITEEEAETHSYRNVILQALGAHGSVNVEVNSVELSQDDTLVLCSDGLSGKVRSEEILHLVQSSPDLDKACRGLVALANERGGEDNITVVIAQFAGSSLSGSLNDHIEPEALARLPETPTELCWDDTAETGPLDERNRTENLPTTLSGETEPLPPAPLFPPTTPIPSAKDAVRQARSTEPIASTEPITKVIRVQEVEEYLSDSSSNRHDEHGSGQASTSDPLAVDYSSALPQNEAAKRDERKTAPASAKQPSKSSRLAIIAFILVGAGLLAITGAFYYFQYMLPQRELNEKETRRQSKLMEMDVLMGQVNESLTLVRTSLTSKQAQNKDQKEKLSKKLDELSDEFAKLKTRKETQVDTISEDDLEDMLKKCEKISKEVAELGEKINTLSVLPASPNESRFPVTC